MRQSDTFFETLNGRSQLGEDMGTDAPCRINHQQVRVPFSGNELRRSECRWQASGLNSEWEGGGSRGKEERHLDKTDGFCCRLLLSLI